MTHQKNLKVIVFVGEDAEEVVAYLTDMHFPKVSSEKIVEQIEDLVRAGQHRIVTSAISNAENYKNLAHEFPGELYLVIVGNASEELTHMAHHHISSDSRDINELLDDIEFRD